MSIDKESVQRNIREQIYNSKRLVKDMIEIEALEENDNEGIMLRSVY